VFTKGDLKSVRDKVLENRVRAPAKAGALAPLDVLIPGCNTGMELGKSSFFQSLGIPTNIARGTIEIVNDVHLVVKGTKVGASEATLLNMLNISPFTYGMTVLQIFDSGTAFPPSVLDIEPQTLLNQFMVGIANIAAISLAAHYPTVASVMHSLIHGYKKLLSVSLATDYEIEGSAQMKAFLSDPSAFAVAAPVVTETVAAPVAQKVEEKVEEVDEDDDDMNLDLFGDF